MVKGMFLNIELTLAWGAELSATKKVAKEIASAYNVDVTFWHNDYQYTMKGKEKRGKIKT